MDTVPELARPLTVKEFLIRSVLSVRGPLVTILDRDEKRDDDQDPKTLIFVPSARPSVPSSRKTRAPKARTPRTPRRAAFAALALLGGLAAAATCIPQLHGPLCGVMARVDALAGSTANGLLIRAQSLGSVR